jgi:general secretion pathway protein N
LGILVVWPALPALQRIPVTMRWIKWLLFVQALLLLLAALLLWLAPASLAYRYVADRLGPVRLDDVSGSVWEGRARQLVAFGVALGPLEWKVSAWSVLANRPEGELVMDGDEVDARARFLRDGNAITLREVDARFPAVLLGPALDIPALKLTGTVALRASEVHVVGGLLASAEGHADWRDVGISGAAQARLPGVRVDFAPAADGGIAARVADAGGPLAIAGTATLRDGRYVSETTFELREPNAQIAEALSWVGQRTPSGGSYLRIEGELHRLTGSAP